MYYNNLVNSTILMGVNTLQSVNRMPDHRLRNKTKRINIIDKNEKLFYLDYFIKYILNIFRFKAIAESLGFWISRIKLCNKVNLKNGHCKHWFI